MKILGTVFCFLFMSYYLLAQDKLALYSGEIPNASQGSAVLTAEDTPVLYTYDVPESKKAVLIIPGGGYARVALQYEGHDVAKAFNAQGYKAFVLYYRLPKVETMVDPKIGPLQDAQRAMQLIRTHYQVDCLGVLGFSAGGHLAASLANHYQDVLIANPSQTSLRPDFAVLAYPVISMEDGITHKGSQTNLLGKAPSAADLAYFSLEKQVTKATPATFLMHAEDDKAVVIANALRYRDALKQAAVAHDLFIYKTGGHGFGLINKTDKRQWADAMFAWLENIN